MRPKLRPKFWPWGLNISAYNILPDIHSFIHKWNEPSCLHSTKQGSTHPITGHYSFIDLERTKSWVGLVGWPCSWRFTHISGHPLAADQAKDRESLPAKDRRSTTVPCNQPVHESSLGKEGEKGRSETMQGKICENRYVLSREFQLLFNWPSLLDDSSFSEVPKRTFVG